MKILKNKLISFLSLVTILLVSSCGWTSFREGLGVATQAPDEFLVDKKKDLTIPTEFVLPPPQNESTTKRRDAAEDARDLIFTNENIKQNNGELSPSEKSLSNNIGRSTYNIRETIENERKNETSVFGLKKGGIAEAIVDPFGYNRPQTKVVDGFKENQRIRKSINAGEPVNEEEVEIIENW